MTSLFGISKESKAVLFVTFSFGAGIALISHSRAVVGYETSVFQSVAPFVWLVFLPLFGLYMLASRRLLPKPHLEDIGWLTVGISFLNGIVLSVPGLHRYFFYGRSDPATVFGRIRYISINGSIGPENLYPATHLLTMILSSITDIGIEPALFIIPLAFVLMVPILFYSFATSLFTDRLYVGLTVISSTVLLLSYRQAYVLFDQQVMAIIYLVFVLYVFHSAGVNSGAFRPALLVVVAALSTFHPVAVLLFLITVALSFCLVRFNVVLLRVRSDWLFLSVLTLSTLVTMEWFVYTTFFDRIVLRISAALSGTLEYTAVSENVTAIGQFSPLAFASLFLRILLHDVLFSLVAGLTSAYLLHKWCIRRNAADTMGHLLIVTWFVVASLVQVGHSVTGVFNLFIYRFVGPIVVLSPILVGVGFGEYIRKRPVSRRLASGLVVGLFLLAAPIGILSAHPNPYTHSVNQQVTESEISSTEWLIEFAPEDGRVYAIVTRPFRFADMIKGTEWRRESEMFFRRGFRIPPHFGYDGGTVVERPLSPDSYIMVSGADRYAISHTSGIWSKYSQSDYEKFRADPSVSKVYSSGVVETWGTN